MRQIEYNYTDYYWVTRFDYNLVIISPPKNQALKKFTLITCKSNMLMTKNKT